MNWRLQNLILALTLPLAPGCTSSIGASVEVTPSSVQIAQQRPRQASPTPTPSLQPSPSRSPTPSNQRTAATPIRFSLPPEGAPGYRGDAATRDACNDAGKSRLIALVPGTNLGLTIAERPTFWFYVSEQVKSTTPVEFMLVDEQENTVYKDSFEVTVSPGIIGIKLPQNVSALEIGKRYHWTLSVICNPGNSRETANVDGEVWRVDKPELQQKLDGVSGRDRILLYAENGLWYDTITNLIELRRQNPQDAQLTKDWEDLLRHPDVALNKIVAEPVVTCCKAR
ncbi:DUF928 domain-containing protein [Planktothrix sp. FACHB-1355]|uniref:DUF928 domain-containing protein n=1 Tax=Aerosakkonema funiforme FACHB-1375 TaxID=2949571 RepID=A0A926VIJ6_9CYAN|nr:MULTISPECIES: DUF928 domain-containing protein [Oscillatoriales]MBD2184546.1 DUF928 domain-containing protein [Aerosakkonema funiforme FACHB-1375]MBD3559565.1 DUF928 domain-containing protein [Planktothrix sp. FACHB-1355]